MLEENKKEKMSGTTIGDSGKANSVDSEVDALIAGAIQELGVEEKKQEPKKAAPIPAAPPKAAPAQKAPAPPKPQTKEEQQYANTFKEYKPGDIVTGTVIKVDNSGALMDIGYKSDGLLKADEARSGVKAGEKIKAMIETLESKEGYVILSKRQADEVLQWDRAFLAYKKREVLEATVKKAVRGGLLVVSNGISGFVPASQVAKKTEDKLESFTGKKIPVKIIQINKKQGKIVFSNRQAAGQKSKVDSQKLFDELEAGQVKKGKVSSLKNFGAFVDVGGAEGLVHLSELSWKRVKHPSELLKAGQEVEVLVLAVDKVNKKISLGMKELQPDPWEKASEKYKAGDVIKVKILRLVKFGAFAELDEELEGLIHMSEISPKRFENLDDVIKPGDLVDAKILRILPDEQKIGLSIKQVILDKEKSALKQVQNEEVKVTIGDMLAEKERQKAEEYEEEPIADEAPAEEPITDEETT
ncbi:30S ribosomal protein S1 [Candidatus Margulisiibacteriota bacterium]